MSMVSESFESRFEDLGRQFKATHDKITALKKNMYTELFVPMRNDDFILQLNNRYMCNEMSRDWRERVAEMDNSEMLRNSDSPDFRITPRDFLFIKDFSVDTVFEDEGYGAREEEDYPGYDYDTKEGKLCVSYTFQPNLQDLIKTKPGEVPKMTSEDLIKHVQSFIHDPIYVTLIISQALGPRDRGPSLSKRNFVKLFVSSKKYPIQNYKCERGEDGLKMVWKKLPANFPIQNINHPEYVLHGIEGWEYGNAFSGVGESEVSGSEGDCDEYTWCGLLNKIVMLAHSPYVEDGFEDHSDVSQCEEAWKNYKSFKSITGVRTFDNPEYDWRNFEEGFWINFMEKWEDILKKLGISRPSKKLKCLELIPKQYRLRYKEQVGF